MYPYQTCCKVVTPEVTKSHVVHYLQIAAENKSYTSFKAFLFDPLTESFFNLHKSTMLGDNIVSSPNGLINYKVKILEDIKMEDTPDYPCIEYGTNGEYARCLEDEILKDNFKFINCTPPWMTDSEDLWCKGRVPYNSHSEASRYMMFLDELRTSEGDPGRCLGETSLKSLNV